jgi:hypothetical protein
VLDMTEQLHSKALPAAKMELQELQVRKKLR